MSKVSTWRCEKCNTLIGPKGLTNTSNIIGFIAVVIPSYFSIYILRNKLLPSLLIGLSFGILTYLIYVLNFYLTVKFEEK